MQIKKLNCELVGLSIDQDEAKSSKKFDVKVLPWLRVKIVDKQGNEVETLHLNREYQILVEHDPHALVLVKVLNEKESITEKDGSFLFTPKLFTNVIKFEVRAQSITNPSITNVLLISREIVPPLRIILPSYTPRAHRKCKIKLEYDPNIINSPKFFINRKEYSIEEKTTQTLELDLPPGEYLLTFQGKTRYETIEDKKKLKIKPFIQIRPSSNLFNIANNEYPSLTILTDKWTKLTPDGKLKVGEKIIDTLNWDLSNLRVTKDGEPYNFPLDKFYLEKEFVNGSRVCPDQKKPFQ